MRSALRGAAVGAAALGLAVLIPSAAQAASSYSVVNTDGSRAGEAWYNRPVAGTHADLPWIDLYDAKCDGHFVYVSITVSWSGHLDHTYGLKNDGGCGTTRGFNLNETGDSITYRACVSGGLWPDTCGPRRTESLR
ncbi:hypothetical protein [Rhizocola hellebori]|nr:hypothetical protein [Rhizocola hellebori]